ncbi:MAG TPA: hypothetical protein VMD07_02135 [Candidatus Acidoferrales bacterium]|nr:hypothetical protein [Candidatus Acidoferrales bacterium]
MSSLQPLEQRLNTLLAEFEEECAQAEVALRARKWDVLRTVMFNQGKIRQAIINELAAERADIRTMPDVFTRLQAIFTFRGDQLRRLTAYRTEVSRRLQLTRKWKDATRSARRGIGPTPMVISRTL